MAQKLFLFLTQAEGGAPGYLSRLGESSVENAVDNVQSFLETLGLDLTSGRETRQRLMNQPERVQCAGGVGQQAAATRFALEVHPDVLFLSGEHVRSMKTAEGIAVRLGLPVVVDRRIDRTVQHSPSIGVLADALRDLETGWLSPSVPSSHLPDVVHPRVVMVATALDALAEWVQGLAADRGEPAAGQALAAALREASEEDTIPAVWIAGHEGGWPGVWISDAWA